MPPRSRSDVSFVKTTLPCPIYAADFDPYNRGYLVVGGGGGESKTGVPNQISVLDVSNRASLSTVVDIELTREEDNVQSLACLATKDGLLVYAGINSSEADQNAGKNEHFRSFSVTCPPRKKQRTDDSSQAEKGAWKLNGKRALFKNSTAVRKETYQRLLRLSPSQERQAGSSRVGAVATGSASTSEVIVFNATTPTPEPVDILTRIELPKGTEARDLDLYEPDTATFSLTYCTDYDIYEQTFEYDFKTKKTEKTPNGPRRVHDIPIPEAPEDPKSRLKLRCLRFLNGQNVVAVLNKPNRKGAELRVYHLYPTGPAILVQRKSLPRRIKQVVSMDVCALNVDASGDQQFVVAVAAQDISIEVYTTNLQRKTETFSPFRSYLTLRDVHKHQMTKICFSTFRTAIGPAKTDAEKTPSAGPKFIRLASVSMGNTVVVDSFPVYPLDKQRTDSRYVLSHPRDETLSRWTHIIVISMIGMFIAYALQSLLLGSDAAQFNILTGEFHGFGRTRLDHGSRESAAISAAASVVQSAAHDLGARKQRLHSLLSAHSVAHPTNSDAPASQQTAVVLRPDTDSTGVTLDVHADKGALLKQDKDAKHWDELKDEQKAWWKAKLKHAGHWVEEEGESIFKGILFSEYAGAMGQAAADVLREL